jgi:acyl carrier protein
MVESQLNSSMDIQAKIKQIIAENLETDINSLDCDQEIMDMEGFDSMRNVLILSNIEDAFDVIIPEDDIFDITTINEWVAEIDKLKAKID